jgi:hypothetical protein
MPDDPAGHVSLAGRVGRTSRACHAIVDGRRDNVGMSVDGGTWAEIVGGARPV